MDKHFRVKTSCGEGRIIDYEIYARFMKIPIESIDDDSVPVLLDDSHEPVLLLKSDVEIVPTAYYTATKYPKIVAHLICESLGYFTPESAANALAAYLRDEPNYCEWYSHMASFRGDAWDPEILKEVGRDVLTSAIKLRHGHKGYMSDYGYAKALVDRMVEKGSSGTMLASWF